MLYTESKCVRIGVIVWRVEGGYIDRKYVCIGKRVWRVGCGYIDRKYVCIGVRVWRESWDCKAEVPMGIDVFFIARKSSYAVRI